MADLSHREDLADRRGLVEALAHVPRTAHVLRLVLQVAAGHVEADAVAEDVFQGLVDRNVGAARLHGDDQLHLVVQILGRRRIGDLGRILGVAADHDGVGRLAEEEGRLAVRIVAHLARMGGIVAADTEDAAHRKQVGGPMDRNADDGRRLDDITHRFLPLARAFMKAAGARFNVRP